jgi:hypothetical protein
LCRSQRTPARLKFDRGGISGPIAALTAGRQAGSSSPGRMDRRADGGEKLTVVNNIIDRVAIAAPGAARETAVIWTLGRSLAAISVATEALRCPLQPHILIADALARTGS